MAFLRFHNTGINTDWIVRWNDDEEQDTLSVSLGVPPPASSSMGVLIVQMHGTQRTALLAYLTETSVDLVGLVAPSMTPDEEETHGLHA